MAKKKKQDDVVVVENERGQQVKLVRIDCPPEIFDVDGAYILRRKRVPIYMIDAIKDSGSADETYAMMAQLVPRWSGVIDVVTGEKLPHPEDDPTVFSKLDMIEQIKWIIESTQKNPKN